MWRLRPDAASGLFPVGGTARVPGPSRPRPRHPRSRRPQAVPGTRRRAVPRPDAASGHGARGREARQGEAGRRDRGRIRGLRRGRPRRDGAAGRGIHRARREVDSLHPRPGCRGAWPERRRGDAAPRRRGVGHGDRRLRRRLRRRGLAGGGVGDRHADHGPSYRRRTASTGGRRREPRPRRLLLPAHVADRGRHRPEAGAGAVRRSRAAAAAPAVRAGRAGHCRGRSAAHRREPLHRQDRLGVHEPHRSPRPEGDNREGGPDAGRPRRGVAVVQDHPQAERGGPARERVVEPASAHGRQPAGGVSLGGGAGAPERRAEGALPRGGRRGDGAGRAVLGVDAARAGRRERRLASRYPGTGRQQSRGALRQAGRGGRRRGRDLQGQRAERPRIRHRGCA